MKKMITLIFLLLITVNLFAPGDERPILIAPVLTHPYAKIIQAIGTVESNRDNAAFNKKEGAAGQFQIRAIRLKDFNHRTGMKYRLKDMHDYTKAVTVFMYYASDFAPDDYEGIAKEWNKSRTNRYWNKVKDQLKNNPIIFCTYYTNTLTLK